jgi:peptidylprolyl isomerase
MLTRTLGRPVLTPLFAMTLACSPAPAERPATESIPAPPDVAAPPADAQRSPSGLAWKVLAPGTGTRHPRPNSEVTVHYTGWTTAGEMFDSSVQRGQAATFGLNQVIKGWTEGVQMMVEGEKRRFWIPADLAYGESPGGGRPAGILVFDIELVRIES